jgi:hypothetical protein
LIAQAVREQPSRCTSRTPICLAHHNDRLPALRKFLCPPGQFCHRHIDRTRQMTGRCRELLGLAHIDKHERITGGKAPLQFIGIDPSRFAHAGPMQQPRQQCDHGRQFKPAQAQPEEVRL